MTIMNYIFFYLHCGWLRSSLIKTRVGRLLNGHKVVCLKLFFLSFFVFFFQTFIVVAERFGSTNILRFSNSKSMFLFSPLHPVRRFTLRVLSHQYPLQIIKPFTLISLSFPFIRVEWRWYFPSKDHQICPIKKLVLKLHHLLRLSCRGCGGAYWVRHCHYVVAIQGQKLTIFLSSTEWRKNLRKKSFKNEDRIPCN